MDTIIIFGAKYLFAVVLICALFPLISMKQKERKTYLITAGLAAVVALVLTQLAAWAYFDPRPFTHDVHALISHAADNGFPSDHTVLSTTAAGITFLSSRKLGLTLLVIALLVGICRVAAGIHSPIDILAGVLIGLIASFGSIRLTQKRS